MSGYADASATVQGIISNAIAVATAKSTEASNYSQGAIEATVGSSWANYQKIAFQAPTVTGPFVPQGDQFGIQQSEMIQLGQRLTDQIAGLMDGFFQKYFLFTNDAFGDAVDWLKSAVAGDGIGISPAIERQIWLREREREIEDTERMQDEALSQWAGRGFALPPGAAAMQLLRIAQDGQDKAAQASRDVAIKSAEIKIENARFAVSEALKQRMSSYTLGLDYIKTVMMGPELAQRLAVSAGDLQAKFIASYVEMENTKLRAAQMTLSAQQTDAQMQTSTASANLQAWAQAVNARATAAGQAARAAGDQGAAALSSLTSMASVNLQESQ